MKWTRFQWLPRPPWPARAVLFYFLSYFEGSDETNITHLLGPVSIHKAYSLLEHVQIEGSALDGCGASRSDSMSYVLSERGCLVTTIDVNRM